MRATVKEHLQEGFLAEKYIEFENGLILRTQNVLWCGTIKRQECLDKLSEVVEAINKGQVEICGS